MGSVILLFSRSSYRSLSKHLSWSPRLLEQVLLVYYQLLQTSPVSVQPLRSQLPHEGLSKVFSNDCLDLFVNIFDDDMVLVRDVHESSVAANLKAWVLFSNSSVIVRGLQKSGYDKGRYQFHLI